MAIDQDLTAVVLPSGLGIRFADLTAKQADEILVSAAKMMTPTSTNIELIATETRMGAEAMIKQVTKGPVKKKPVLKADGTPATDVHGKPIEEDDINSPQNVWVPFDPDQYDLVIRSPKDHAALKQIYTQRTKCGADEVAAIMGKAVTVTT